MLFDQKRYLLKGRFDFLDRTFDIVGVDGTPLGVAQDGDVFEAGGGDAAPILTVHHPFKIFGDKVTIKEGDRTLGSFRFPLVPDESFQFLDADDFEVATIYSDMGRSHFQIVAVDGAKLGEVIREWGGFVNATIGGAHTYEVSIATAGEQRAGTAAVVLGTALAIDIAFPRKE